MPRRIGVEILSGCLHRIPGVELRRIARATMDLEGLEPEIELDIVLADDKTMQDLNRQFREIDEPTDVLSFPNAPDEIWTWPDEPPSLGEIIVCAHVADKQSQETGQPVEGILAHSLVHGVLHMVGYDHEESEEDSERMRQREDEILQQLGYVGQYSHGHAH